MTTATKELKVLLVEDSEEDAALILMALRKGDWDLATKRVDTASALKAVLADESWDLILSDYSMPGFDGLAALRIVKEFGIDIPIILISGTIGEELAVAAMKAGANDYLMKDNLHRLVPAVERELREYQYRCDREEELHQSELKLLQAQKMEIVGRLSGGIAHDFNNLLAVILGNVDLLQAKLSLINQAPVEIGGIERAALHASTLVRQLLAFSRKQALQTKAFDLNQTLREITPMLELMVGDSIEVKLETCAEQPAVKMDRVQLEQVLLNLASNARDAMRKNGQLILTTHAMEMGLADIPHNETADPGPYARISVRDTGCGMDAKTMASIFEPFFTTKDIDKGTGLGLSTTVDIIRNSGGFIQVESEVGVGTQFHLYLPTVPAAIQTTETREPARVEAGKGKKILVVEDNNELRKLTREVLLIGKYEVAVCADYEEVDKALQAGFAPDLILSDLKIPRQDGHPNLPDLLAKNPHWKVICMSGYSSDEAINMGLMDGKFTFLEKPFTPSKLLQTIREVLAAPA